MIWALEQVLPRYDKREYHSTWIDAPPSRVWAALDELRVRDLPLSMALARLRGGPAAWFGTGWHDQEGLDRRALDMVAPRQLAQDPPWELVLGDIANYAALRPSRPDIPRGDLDAFRAFDAPGWSKVAMNFRLGAQDGGTRLSTETRVLGTDAAARLAFRFYWLAVRAGSGLIRHDILRAVAARATRVTA
jgi:hypothetical protein